MAGLAGWPERFENFAEPVNGEFLLRLIDEAEPHRLPSLGEAESQPGDFGNDFSDDFYKGEIVIDATPPVPLAPICEQLYKFWKALIDKMP